MNFQFLIAISPLFFLTAELLNATTASSEFAPSVQASLRF